MIPDSDSLLEAMAKILVEKIPELRDRNVITWHHGQGDPSEDISQATGRSSGVCVMLLDTGGEETAGEGNEPILEHELHAEIYIDSTKRGKMKPGQRYGGRIRDSIMRSLHLNAQLRPYQHCMFDLRVRGFQRIADPDYTVWRVRLARTFDLAVSPD